MVGHDPVMVKHATASVFVFCNVAQGWRLGLIRHPIFGRLMIPGGHVEPYESQPDAALREVSEEAGLKARLIEAPGAPLPASLTPFRVAQPWWILKQRVPHDNRMQHAHFHLDHLYVAVTHSPEPMTEPEHPFGWYSATELAGLELFDDTRLLASTLFQQIGELTGS